MRTMHAENKTAVLDDLPHLFERFYRSDQSRTDTTTHLGLGLAICKAIVDARGGSIESTSQPGSTTVFTVLLPVCRTCITRSGRPTRPSLDFPGRQVEHSFWKRFFAVSVDAKRTREIKCMFNGKMPQSFRPCV